MAKKKHHGRSMQDVVAKFQPQQQQQLEVNQEEENQSSDQASSSSRKGRGSAKPSSTWNTGRKLQLTFNDYLQPIGENKNEFMSHLGVIARSGNKIPLTYLSWEDVPEDILDSLWREVQDNTNAPLEYRKGCLQTLGNKWRNWRHRAKKRYFLGHETDEECLEMAPKEILDDQWKLFVEYWKSEESKAIAKRNCQNREKQGLPHRTGRKGFCDIRHQMQQNGELVDRMSVFLRTRATKSGVDLDPKTQEKISQMNGRLAEVSEIEQTPEVREKIFREVMGPEGHGHVRTYGLGPSYKDVFGSTLNVPADVTIQALRNEMITTKAQLESQQMQINIMLAFLEKAGYHFSPMDEQDVNGASSSSMIW